MFMGSISGWSLAATGNGTFQPFDSPTPVNLDAPIPLDAGASYAFALVAPATATHYYTNGTGANQFFSNADLSLSLGAATNVPFDNSPFSPRVWNGSLTYSAVSAIPEPEAAIFLTTLLSSSLLFRFRSERRRLSTVG